MPTVFAVAAPFPPEAWGQNWGANSPLCTLWTPPSYAECAYGAIQVAHPQSKSTRFSIFLYILYSMDVNVIKLQPAHRLAGSAISARCQSISVIIGCYGLAAGVQHTPLKSLYHPPFLLERRWQKQSQHLRIRLIRDPAADLMIE
jgi:hypothetical protein